LEEALEHSDVCCRRCRATLLQPLEKPRGVFLLPSPMWQACADTMACEECAPLGLQHLAAKPGQLFISPQCLIVSGTDVVPASIRRGAASEGLLRCSACQFILGETAADSTAAAKPAAAKAGAPRGGKRKAALFCGEWSQSAGCKHEGFALYKHRVELAIPTKDSRTAEAPTAAPSPSPSFLPRPLTATTEVAAVAAQLLALRSSAGTSRFLVCAGPPSGLATLPGELGAAPDPDASSNNSSGGGTPLPGEEQVLEMRIIVPELLILGPTQEGSSANLGGNFDQQQQQQQQQQQRRRQQQQQQRISVPTLRRVTKVSYRQRRRRPEDSSSGDWLTLTIPPEAFEEVIENLQYWMGVLPTSYSLSPFSSKDGLGMWRCSCLTLPPRDSSNCTE